MLSKITRANFHPYAIRLINSSSPTLHRPFFTDLDHENIFSIELNEPVQRFNTQCMEKTVNELGPVYQNPQSKCVWPPKQAECSTIKFKLNIYSRITLVGTIIF